MKKSSIFVWMFAVSLLVLMTLPVFALVPNQYDPKAAGAGNPEVHIKRDGNITVSGARVTQNVGSTFYLMVKWGEMTMNFTMKTSDSTRVVKRYGGAAKVSQISIGDYIDVEGSFFVGSDFFGVTAESVKDWSLQEENETFSGRIIEINPDMTFTLQTSLQKNVTVRQATSTVIRKGGQMIPWGKLTKGDSVLRAGGVYDYSKNTLIATDLTIHLVRTPFIARNYEGVLTSLGSPKLPTTLTVTVSGTDYTVELSLKTEVLKKNRKAAELARFVVGDTVRFFGPLREAEKVLHDAFVVDAEVVRNMDL